MNRITDSTDAANALTYTINEGLIRIMQPYDLYLDTYTSVPNKGIFINNFDENSTFSTSMTGAASGNNIGDPDFVVSSTISSDRPTSGAFKVFNGATYDYYKYSSFTGSTFTLDSTHHPSGLIQTYAGSEQVWVPRLRNGFNIFYESTTLSNDISYSDLTFGKIGDLLSDNNRVYHSYIDPVDFKNKFTVDLVNSDVCLIFPLNGQVKFNRLDSESQNLCCEITDLNCIFYGELNSYPGLRDGWGSYRSGTFGFWFTDTEYAIGVRMCSIAGDNLRLGGWIGCEINHGGSQFRIARSNANQEYGLVWKRCLGAYSISQEGGYIGQTTANAANPVITFIDVNTILLCLTGTEAAQWQNIFSNVAFGSISNITAFLAAIDKSAFQDNQNTGFQLHFQTGNIDFKNFVLYGWGSIGVHVFSSDLSARGLNPTGLARIKNGVMDDGRQMALRTHGSMVDGPELEYSDIDILRINNTSEETNDPVVDYLAESATETGNFQHYKGITYPSGKASFFAATGASNSFAKSYSLNITETDSIPPLEFVNSGFPERPEKIEIWCNTVQQNGGAASNYFAGDIVANPLLNDSYKFHKCLSDHVSDDIGITTRPDQSVGTLWSFALTWDESGIRSDLPGHNSGDTQSFLPPLDVRLKADNYHANKLRGVYPQRRTDRDQVRYYWKENLTAQEKEIPGEYGGDLVFDKYEYLIPGRYIDVGVAVKAGSKQPVEVRQGFVEIV